MLGLVLAYAAMASAGEAADTQTSAKPAQPAAEEATLFPVPDYTGDIWRRSRLTGDWGGLRTKLANNGVQLEMDITHYYQDVASGGVDTTGRYIGTAEIVLKIDSHKMGLWPGGFLFVRGEAAFKQGVNAATGALMPVNTGPVLQLPNRDDMILPHVIFTQFLSEKFGVALGKLDTTVGDDNEFAHGRGDDKFMNLAFSLNPVGLRTTPYSALGMALVYLPTKDLMLTFSVLDTEGVPTKAGFDTLFKDGTTLAPGLRWTIRPFGLTGHQTLAALWSNKEFTSLSQDPRTLIGNILFGTPLKKVDGSWAVMYNLDQYLYQKKEDPTQGFGIFGRVGVSDGKANPIAQFYSFGFGGKGMIPGREQDHFGIGYYYLKIAGDLRDTFPPLLLRRVGLDHEQGGEMFYNIAVLPWFHVTADLQVIDSAINKLPLTGPDRKPLHTAVVFGLRAKIDF
jgi:porin